MDDRAARLGACVEKLEGDGEAQTLLEDVNAIFLDLLPLGPSWPDEDAYDEFPELFERLGQQLPNFTEEQQKRVVAEFAPLRRNIQQHMLRAVQHLNDWLHEAPPCGAEQAPGAAPSLATPEMLAEHLGAVDQAPQLLCYKQINDVELKTRFIFVLACTVRIASEASLLRSFIVKHMPALVLVQRVSSAFFTFPGHGNILAPWLDSRLDGYGMWWRREVQSALQLHKVELQERLLSALRAGLAARKATANVYVFQLSEWPMTYCPLTHELLAFLSEKSGENLDGFGLGDSLLHSLRPDALAALLKHFSAVLTVHADGAGMPRSVQLFAEVTPAPSAAPPMLAACHGPSLQFAHAPPANVAPAAVVAAPAPARDMAQPHTGLGTPYSAPSAATLVAAPRTIPFSTPSGPALAAAPHIVAPPPKASAPAAPLVSPAQRLLAAGGGSAVTSAPFLGSFPPPPATPPPPVAPTLGQGPSSGADILMAMAERNALDDAVSAIASAQHAALPTSPAADYLASTLLASSSKLGSWGQTSPGGAAVAAGPALLPAPFLLEPESEPAAGFADGPLLAPAPRQLEPELAPEVPPEVAPEDAKPAVSSPAASVATAPAAAPWPAPAESPGSPKEEVPASADVPAPQGLATAPVAATFSAAPATRTKMSFQTAGSLSKSKQASSAGGFGVPGVGGAGAVASSSSASRVSAPAPQTLGFDAPASGAKRAAVSKPGSIDGAGPGGVAGSQTKTVRRKMDWEDLKFLRRIVRRGVRVDEEWRTTWQGYCLEWKIGPDLSVVPPKDPLTMFVERNMYQLVNKEWAKDLMFRDEAEGERAPPPRPAPGSPPASDGEAEVAGAAPRTPPSEPEDGGMGMEASGKAADGATKKAAKRKREGGSSGSSSSGSSSSEKEDASLPTAIPPHNYKVKMCHNFLEGKCPQGKACADAHAEKELRPLGLARREWEERHGKLHRPEPRSVPEPRTEVRPVPARGGPRPGPPPRHMVRMGGPEEQHHMTGMTSPMLMMNPMMGVPMMMGGMNGQVMMGMQGMPTEMVSPHMHHQYGMSMPSFGTGPPHMQMQMYDMAADGWERKGKRKDARDGKANKKDKNKDKEREKAKEKDRDRDKDKGKKEKEKEKFKATKEKASKEKDRDKESRQSRAERRVDDEDL